MVSLREFLKGTNMPIYEYLCKDCNFEFETLVRSSSQKIECTKCKSDQVEKKFSTFGMKSDGKFTSSRGSSCSDCSSGNCGSCNCKH